MKLEANPSPRPFTISYPDYLLQAQPRISDPPKQAARSILPRLLNNLYRDALQREALAEYLEQLLRQLRGEALLIATLAYGLGVRLSALRSVRLRDVSVFDSCIVISGRDYVIPNAIREDLKEHLHDKVCGYEAGTSINRRDDKIFADDAFATLISAFDRVRNLCTDQNVCPKKSNFLAAITVRACADSMLRIASWLHRRLATRKGALFSSPLELFDRGPRIVRRGRSGALNAYYVWRTTRAVL
jgi:integrase